MQTLRSLTLSLLPSSYVHGLWKENGERRGFLWRKEGGDGGGQREGKIIMRCCKSKMVKSGRELAAK